MHTPSHTHNVKCTYTLTPSPLTHTHPHTLTHIIVSSLHSPSHSPSPHTPPSVLQECHHQLHADLTDKHSALQIDTETAELTNTSDTITLQTDPTRIKKGYVPLIISPQ